MLKKLFLSNLAAFSLFISNTNAMEVNEVQSNSKKYCYASLSIFAHATTSGIINYWLNGDILGGAVLGSLAALNEQVHFFKKDFAFFPPFLGSIIGKMGYDLASAFVKKRSITSPIIPLCCSALSGVAAFTFENYLGKTCGLTKLLSGLSLDLPIPPSAMIALFGSPLIVTSIVQRAFKLKVHPVTYIAEVLLPILDFLAEAACDDRGQKGQASCIMETSLSVVLGSISCLIQGFKKIIKN